MRLERNHHRGSMALAMLALSAFSGVAQAQQRSGPAGL